MNGWALCRLRTVTAHVQDNRGEMMPIRIRISFPDFPWQRLRKEFPEKYESYADLVPGEWTKVKIEVRGDKAHLYVHGAEQPALLVNDLKQGQSQGGIALWVGPGTVAHFSNLRVSR
jgi:hypothetical protein